MVNYWDIASCLTVNALKLLMCAIWKVHFLARCQYFGNIDLFWVRLAKTLRKERFLMFLNMFVTSNETTTLSINDEGFNTLIKYILWDIYLQFYTPD